MTWSRRWAVDRPGQDNGALTMGPQLLTDALRSGMHFNWPVTKPLHLAGKDYGARVRVMLSARARHSHAAHAREATMATPNASSPRTPANNTARRTFSGGDHGRMPARRIAIDDAFGVTARRDATTV